MSMRNWLCLFIFISLRAVAANRPQREPWHILNISSHLLNISLTSSSLVEAQKLCPQLANEYEIVDCFSLTIQSHRTLRLFYIESLATDLGLESMEFSRLLAYSYAFENCPSEIPKYLPINVCFFGEISPLVILLTLLSCENYHLKFFNVYDVETQHGLARMKERFPDRSIEWIPGHYSTHFQSSFLLPQCHIIHTTVQSIREFLSLRETPMPVPLPIEVKSLPCQGRGMLLLYSPIVSSPAVAEDRISLKQLYKNRTGVDLDWRLHIVTADISKHLSIKDSEGFLYRLMQRYFDSTTSRIDIACRSPSSSSPSSSPSITDSNSSQVAAAMIPTDTNAMSAELISFSSCPDIVITFCNRVFTETAIGLQQAVSRTFPNLVVVIWSDMNLALLNITCGSPLQIAIAPHEETPLLSRYIVFQMEQTWSDYLSETRFQTVLQEATEVWTFSRQQYQLLSQIGVPISNLKSLPLYTDRRYSENTLRIQQNVDQLPEQSKSIDVLFFGSTSQRRHQFVLNLQQLAVTHGLVLGGILGGAEINLFRKKRDDLVRNSKIVVNVHTQETSALEVHRLNYLLSMGACIISETSSDPEIDSLYSSGIFFVHLDEIPATLLHLLQDEEGRKAASEAALNLSRAILDSTIRLKEALDPHFPSTPMP